MAGAHVGHGRAPRVCPRRRVDELSQVHGASAPLGHAGGRLADRLAGGQAGTDDAGRPERFVGGAHAAAGDEQVIDVPGLQTAKRDVVGLPVLQILVGRAELSLVPQLDGPARPGHRVLELAAGRGHRRA